MIQKGETVLSRDGTDMGTVKGDGRSCRQIEGCLGRQVPVRWRNGELTWPCTKGMRKTKEGWQIA